MDCQKKIIVSDCWTDNVKDFISSKTDNMGADIFFECVGKNETIVQAVELAASGRQICFAGNPYTDLLMDKNVYWKILRNQLTVNRYMEFLLSGTWGQRSCRG